MVRKKKHWCAQTLKSMVIAAIMYRFAKMFMNIANKQSAEKKVRKSRKKTKSQEL